MRASISSHIQRNDMLVFAELLKILLPYGEYISHLYLLLEVSQDNLHACTRLPSYWHLLQVSSVLSSCSCWQTCSGSATCHVAFSCAPRPVPRHPQPAAQQLPSMHRPRPRLPGQGTSRQPSTRLS